METLLLSEIVIIFLLSIAVLLVCHKLHIPTLVGLLFTGVFVGPHALGVINSTHDVEIFAEIGVVLLLFTIGIEFSFERFLKIRKSVLVGGSLQVFITITVIMLISVRFGYSYGEAIFLGFLGALSSTAIVFRTLQDRAEVDSPHGSTALGMLIFQDIIIVPMILVLPLMVGSTGDLTGSLTLLLGKGIGIILPVIVAAKWVVPWLLYMVAKTRRNELFLITVVFICFGVAWLTSIAGLSLALGAFLAGLIISESEFSHRALGNIMPLRDVFTTFFFISIGMMLDVGFLIQNLGLVALVVLVVLVLKSTIAGFVTMVLGFPLRTGILVGLTLSQVGEFSFILSRSGILHGLLTDNLYQLFLAVAVISMAATPFVIMASHRLADKVMNLPIPKRLKIGTFTDPETKIEAKSDHLIIIGFGVNGKNVARAAKTAGIPYAIIEMNPETVRTERSKGEPIYYGDAAQDAVLLHAGVKEARIVVAVINDPTAIRRITEIVRRLNPAVHLIVRTRYLREMKPLFALGADEVIPEEFETSVEIFTRVLTKYLVPRDSIEKLVAEIRADGYEMFRSLSKGSPTLSDLNFQHQGFDIGTFRISEGSTLTGKTIADIALRTRYGVSVVAICRDSKMIVNPGADAEFQVGDTFYILGSTKQIAGAVPLFTGN